MQYNKPTWLLIPRIIASSFSGGVHPSFGIIFAKIMELLSLPLAYFTYKYPKNPNYLKDEMNLVTYYTLGIAGISLIAIFFQRWCFAILGENVTLSLRKLLYKSILMKHYGWFDFKEHGSSVLTSAMA